MSQRLARWQDAGQPAVILQRDGCGHSCAVVLHAEVRGRPQSSVSTLFDRVSHSWLLRVPGQLVSKPGGGSSDSASLLSVDAQGL